MTAPAIKATVKRDGPGEWSFVVVDDQGEIVAGVESSWADAYRAATAELELLDAGEPADPGVVIRGRWETVIPPAAKYRAAALELDAAKGAIDLRPGWRRWLGLP
jgi:hypothetical protein